MNATQTHARTRKTIANAAAMDAERLNYWIDVLSFPRTGHNDASREAKRIHEIAKAVKPIALRIAVSEVLSSRVMGAPIIHDIRVLRNNPDTPHDVWNIDGRYIKAKLHDLRVLRNDPDTPHDVWNIEGLYIKVKPSFEDADKALRTITLSDARTCAVAVELVEGVEGFPPSTSRIFEEASSAELILAHQAIHDNLEEIKANALSLARELIMTVFYMA